MCSLLVEAFGGLGARAPGPSGHSENHPQPLLEVIDLGAASKVVGDISVWYILNDHRTRRPSNKPFSTPYRHSDD